MPVTITDIVLYADSTTVPAATQTLVTACNELGIAWAQKNGWLDRLPPNPLPGVDANGNPILVNGMAISTIPAVVIFFSDGTNLVFNTFNLAQAKLDFANKCLQLGLITSIQAGY